VTHRTDGPAGYGHDKATLERFWGMAGPVRAVVHRGANCRPCPCG